jgi:menaquinone-dependent protoporphyrinogen oxidase
MTNKIIVTYASQGGSTAGVAEAIGRRLRENGAEVDVLQVERVRDLSAYQAVVLGSAVHSGKWLPTALRFTEHHQAALRRIPTAIFQVCLTLACDNPQYHAMAPTWLAPLRAQLQPLAEGSFAGALWPARYARLSEKIGLHIFLAAIRLKPGDYRDWSAIHAWTDKAGPLLLKG